MKTLLCTIAKNENRYLREFVEWYKSIGFTNICLYDNNDVDGERFEEVISDYIDNGFVIVKDWRGNTNKPQIPAYQSCYDEYGDKYDWIAFFDVDEFLEFDNGKNAEDFFSQKIFSDTDIIRVCWKNFSDSGLVRVENGNYSRTRFTETIKEKSMTAELANRSTKIIVHGWVPDFHFINEPGGEHGWYLPNKTVDCHGNICDNNQLHVIKEKIWDNAWLCHYRFKTMEEYCKFKLKRGYANVDFETGQKSINLKEFYDYNDWTREKQDLYDELVGPSEITCCLLNYKHDENTMKWYDRLKSVYNTYIIDTNYLDNGGECPFDVNDSHILLCHNLYFGGSTLKAYEIMKKDGGKWLMAITTDVECNDENFPKLIECVSEVVKRQDIGVWEASAAKGSYCNGATMVIPTNVHQYYQGTGKMRDVKCGEGWFEFVNCKVADYVIPKLNYVDNKHGWGINDMFNRAARKFKLRVVIDDRVVLFHPAGTVYNNQEAAAEYERVKMKFEEYGLMEEEDKKKEELKTLVCCIGKNENRYVREYVDWYKEIGVTNICLYDNNDVDGERFEDVIGEEIKNGYVIYNDWRGKKNCQLDAYQDCYDRFGKEYDWILFIDCGDEYLDFMEPMKIQDYLTLPQFVNFDEIHINLMTFGDSDVADYKEGTLLERFPEPIPYDTPVAYNFPENCHVSTIVRGGLEKVEWKGVTHTPSNPLRCCNAIGVSVDPTSPFTFPYNFDLAFFRHYTTKTAREYAWKMQRGFPDQLWDGSRIKNLVETRFFRTNKITKEKVDILSEELNIDFSYLLPYTGEKSKDVQIFTLCYAKKDFKFLDNKYVTPLQVGAANGTDVCELKDNTGENISASNFFYIENTGTFWIWRNVHDAKYKGQMQYRRPLIGIDDDTDFEKIFSEYDVITCEPFHHPDHMKPTKEEPMVIPASTVEGGYAFSNCMLDLISLEKLVKANFPEYAKDWDKYIKNGEDLYYSSGFIMRAEDYDRYCEFLFNCLSLWIRENKIGDIFDLYIHVARNLGAGKYIRYPDPMNVPKEAIKWQTEIGGFLGERLWTLWLQHNFKPEKIYKLPYKKMEENMYT